MSDLKPTTISHIVLSNEQPIRIDSYLAHQSFDLSRSQIQKLLKTKNILVNDQTVESSYKIRLGDRIAIEMPKFEKIESKAESIDLEIIYQDSEIAVINKPAELVVHAAAGHSSGTLVNALLYHLKDLSNIGGVLRPGIVHRLDKGTSGIMLVAKTNQSHLELSRQFQAREIEKTYLALAYGSLKKEKGILKSFLGRSRANRKKISSKTRRGREAVTEYRVIPVTSVISAEKGVNKVRSKDSSLSGNDKKINKRGDSFSPMMTLLEVTPKTGRTHQIRVHLAEAGHPIVGDPLYGGKQWTQKLSIQLKNLVGELNRQALHAWKITFTHPTLKKQMEFEAKIPEDLEVIIKKLS